MKKFPAIQEARRRRSCKEPPLKRSIMFAVFVASVNLIWDVLTSIPLLMTKMKTWPTSLWHPSSLKMKTQQRMTSSTNGRRSCLRRCRSCVMIWRELWSTLLLYGRNWMNVVGVLKWNRERKPRWKWKRRDLLRMVSCNIALSTSTKLMHLVRVCRQYVFYLPCAHLWSTLPSIGRQKSHLKSHLDEEIYIPRPVGFSVNVIRTLCASKTRRYTASSRPSEGLTVHFVKH